MSSLTRRTWQYRWFFLTCAAVVMHAFVWHSALQRHSRNTLARVAPAEITFSAGLDGTVSGRDSLKWDFTSPPAPGVPMEEWTLNGPIVIRPDVPGRFIWTTPSNLVFSPAMAWPSCSEFEADLPVAWTIAGATSNVAFRTAALKVDTIRLAEVRPDRRTLIQILFNAPAGDGNAVPYIELLDANQRPVPFTLSRQNAGRLIMLTTDPVQSEKIQVKIKQGFPAVEGPRGLTKTAQETLTLRDDFALIGHECAAPAFGPVTITLRMSQTLDTRTVLDGITVSPELKISARVNTPYGSWDPSDRIILTGAFEPGRQYQICLPESLQSETGYHLAGTREFNVIVPDRTPGLRVIGAGNILSRDGAKQVRLETVNVDTLDIRLEKLYPNNLPWFIHRRDELASRYWWHGESSAFAGLSRQLTNCPLTLLHRRNQPRETTLHIPELTGDVNAAGIFLLTASQRDLSIDQMINLTGLAITTRQTPAEGLAWVTRLHDATPSAGVRITVLSAENQPIATEITGSDGCFRWKSPEALPAAILIAESENDTTYLNLADSSLTLPDPVDGAPYPTAEHEAWLLSERNLYRPDDTVRLTALVRNRQLGAAPAALPVQLDVIGPDGKPWTSRSTTLDEAGSAAFTLALPAGLRTGAYRAELRWPDSRNALGDFTFNVQAFMPPRMEVTLKTGETDAVPPIAPQPINATVIASYYHGGAAADLPVEAVVQFDRADFRPSGFDDYSFTDNARPFAPLHVSLGSGQLDKDGKFSITIPTDKHLTPPSMLNVSLAATVQDHDGRTASALAVMPLHVYSRYAGLKIGGGQAVTGKPLNLQAALISTDGRPVSERAELNVIVERLEWSYRTERDNDGVYRYRSTLEAVPLGSFQLTTEQGSGGAEWTPPEDGQYRVTLEDPLSGARSSRIIHTTGLDGYDGTVDLENPYRLALALDEGAVHLPGATARIHVTAPFTGTALISVEGPDLFWSAVQAITTTTTVLTIPLPENVRGHGVYCSVTLVRPLVPGAQPLPVRASGIIRIPVSRPAVALSVAIDPSASPLPSGQTGSITVTVHDAQGAPAAGATVWLIGVDEAITALGNWPLPDPIRDLLRNRRLDTWHADPFQMLLPEWGDLPIQRFDAVPGGDSPVVGANRLNPFRGRRYTPTAWWIGRFTTDAQGRVVADAHWPDFDGRLRLTAVAATSQALGAASESRICRHPVILRSGLPRSFAIGDRATVSIDIINRTDDQTLDLNIALQTEGPLQAQWTNTTLRLTPGNRHELTVPVVAGSTPGDAIWRLSASGAAGDITETIVIPVQEIRQRQVIRQAILIPSGEIYTWPSYPDLAEAPLLTFAGTPVPHLQPLLNDLLDYPYGCLEQTISRVFPLLTLHHVATFSTPDGIGLTKEGVNLRIQQAVQRVLTMQRPDGSFGYWSGDSDNPFVWGTVFAAHFLAEASRQGQAVPSSARDGVYRYLENAVLPAGASSVQSADNDCRRALAAYACRVLAIAGRPPRNWMRTLHERVSLLDAESVVHLAAAFAEDADRRTALELLHRTDSTSARPPAGADDANLAGELRTLAVIADGWNRQDPTLPESVSAAMRLTTAIKQQSYLNTQEQTWALTALLPGALSPVTGTLSAELMQEGKSKAISLAPDEVQTVSLDQNPAVPAVLHNTGTAPLFAESTFVVLARQTDNGTDSLSVANGLRIKREWLDRDGQPLTTAAVKRGDLLVAAITIESLNGATVDHVIIDDRFPSGLEAESSVQTLAVTLPWLRGRNTLPLRYSDMRDDRALFFADRFSGTQTIHYALRAVTPGRYYAAPVNAEQMYNAAINARGPSGSFEVLP